MVQHVSVLEKKFNNFQRNEQILMKFSGTVQIHASNFWAGGLRSASLHSMALGQNGLCLENLSPT